CLSRCISDQRCHSQSGSSRSHLRRISSVSQPHYAQRRSCIGSTGIHLSRAIRFVATFDSSASSYLKPLSLPHGNHRVESLNRDSALIVIGGGPGGTSAASTSARAGARVLLLERGSFPRHKVCGEFVSAESLSLLQWLLGNSHHTLLQDSIRLTASRLF